MTIKIRGLVRSYRQAQEKLTGGIDPADRQEFRDRILAIVAKADALCRRHGQTVEDLPAPSRNALENLRRIAAIPAKELPLPGSGTEKPPRIRVTRVEASLRDGTTALGNGCISPAEIESTFRDMVRSVETIECICRENDTTPAGMPARSRQAFSMLKWLAVRENFDKYASQAAMAHPFFAKASEILWPGCELPVTVSFHPGRHIFSAKMRQGLHTFRLALGFLDAGPGDLEDLAAVVAKKRNPPQKAHERFKEFVEAPEFGRIALDVETAIESGARHPSGRAYDLEEIFDRLNARFFEKAMSRPGLHWHPTTSRRQFGAFSPWRDLILMNPLLDDPRLPAFVPEFVLYHELLHRKHGGTRQGSRRVWHSAAFREDERRHPKYEEARGWIEALASGWNGGPLPDTPRSAPASKKAAKAPLRPGGKTPSNRSPKRVARPATKPAGLPASPSRPPGRNEPCPCGSGRKYKRCCLGRKRN